MPSVIENVAIVDCQTGDIDASIENGRHAITRSAGRPAAPAFACSPDLFPDLMAAAIQKRDIGQWAATQNLVIERGKGEA